MSAKIIDSRRYKTITKSQLERKRKKNENILKAEKASKNKVKKNTSSASKSNSTFISNIRIKKHTQKKREQEMLLYSRPQRTVIKEPKQKVYIPKSAIIASCIILCLILSLISIKITKLDEKISKTVFSDTNEESTAKSIVLEQNYNLKVGLTSLDSYDLYDTKNLIINDLYKNISPSLIKVKDNYDIVYMVAKNIQKIDNKNYLILLNDTYKYNLDDIKFSYNKILSSGKNSAYYEKISNIESINNANEKNSIIITLKNEDPYFIYDLDFPIIDEESKKDSGYIYSHSDNSILFKRTKNSQNANLESINIIGYNSLEDVVSDFTQDKLDCFFATSNNDMQLIGKKDYNVKKYKDGETLFILGNKNSSIFSQKEVRMALMYSLNRDELVKKSNNNFIEVIDLPFLYSSIKYKYDISGAKNIMESNGWYQNAYGTFEKNIDGKYYNATLKLLVNNQDQDKMNIAQNIKDMAKNVGINIEIFSLSKEEIQQKINNFDYDIVLATIHLNENPDVEFLRNHIDINDQTAQAFEQVKNSSAEDLSKNIQNLEYVLSDEVACIGIYARNINMVYQKYLYFTDINYMKIFSDLPSIGKIAN